jgi:DNA-binding NarL/FixJ family response regulator
MRAVISYSELVSVPPSRCGFGDVLRGDLDYRRLGYRHRPSDRHMPGLSGEDLLSELVDRDYYGRVVMVTAVDPGIEVLDMPFDDYLCKPVDREEL